MIDLIVADISLILFAGVLSVLGGMSLRRNAGHYEFPFLAVAVFAGFILIQAVGLRNDPAVPESALTRVTLMSTLCVVACYVGFTKGATRLPILNWKYDPRRLFWASLALVMTGAFFWLLISRLPKEMTALTQWSGKPVAYRFIAQCFSYGLAVALLIFLKKKSKAAAIPILIGAFLYADLAVVGVKRSAAAEFLFMVLLSVWFVKRRCVPKVLVLFFVMLGILANYSIGDVRAIIIGEKAYTSTLKGDFLPSANAFKTLTPVGKVNEALKRGAPEVRNAALLMEGVAGQCSFDFGLNDWNAMIFSLVPAQLLGRDFKEAMMFRIDSPIATGSAGGYDAPNGSTFTGVADAYASFWYIGCLKFFLIGWILGNLNSNALSGNLGAAVLYMALIVVGLESITHTTTWFFSRLVHACVFALPALWYAKTGYAAPHRRTTVPRVALHNSARPKTLIRNTSNLLRSTIGLGRWSSSVATGNGQKATSSFVYLDRRIKSAKRRDADQGFRVAVRRSCGKHRPQGQPAGRAF